MPRSPRPGQPAATLAAPWHARPAAFPNAYCWFVLVGSLDLMLTNFALTHAGAVEVNGLAAAAIERAGFAGLIALKVSTMLVVIAICEVLAHRAAPTARRLAEWAVAISLLPVVLTLAQLAAHGARLHG